MIPEGWSNEKLGNVSSYVTSGSRGWAKFYAETGDIFVRITNLNRKSIILDYTNTKFVSLPRGSNEGLRTRLQSGDILISITADLGTIGFIPEEPEIRHFINQHIALVRVKTKAIYPRYLAYYLSTDYLHHTILRLNDAGAKAGLNLTTIRSIPIRYPTLPEQKKIAEILSTWDRAIEVTEKLLENATTQKRALMQQLLTPKTRFPEFKGQEWREVRLGELCMPKQWPTISSSNLLASGYPVYGANGFIGYYSDYNHEYETVTVTCRGSTCGTLSLIPPKSYITGNSMCLDGIDHAKTDPRFLYFALIQRGLKHVISGSAQPQIIGKDLRKVKLVIPNLEEQIAIQTIISAAAKNEDQIAKFCEKLKLEKKALMQQLLTGKRRVKV